MTSRVQESPFRETEWDQRLDRMLDDLKTTVGSEAEISSPDVRSDSALVSSFRSTSRNEGRSSSRGVSRSGSALGGVEDGGHMRHSRREYRSPEDNTHVVTEKYEYDTGDSSKQNHFQKKVIKSTYSTFNSMSAGSLEDPPHLTQGPESPPQPPVNTKVISASQKVANRLVDALATIGSEEGYVPTVDSSDTDTLATDTMKTTKTVGSDYSTLGRLRKDINELDSLIISMDKSQQQNPEEPPPPVEVLNSAPPEPVEPEEHDVRVILQASELPPYDEEEIHSIAVTDPSVALTLAAAKAHSHSINSTTQISHAHTCATVQDQKTQERRTAPSTSLANGSLRSTHSSKYDGDDEMIDDSKSGEVRRIVWRNRFEKTYETQDSSKPPVVSIEEEARRRQLIQKHQQLTSTSTSNSTLSSHPGPSSPLQVSPGGQSWKEPIPLPTPPQLSPREPGVAYIYTYGNPGSGVQPLPPLNYASVPGPSSVPPSEGAPSPTPSQLQGQPIIYHYSYHYTIQPGQPLPDGAPPPPGTAVAPGSPPALQMAPSSPPGTHPSQPVTVQLNQSGQPGHPSHPGQPGHPSHPGKPGHPSHLGQPGHPSHPGQPGQPGHPSHPGQPGQPGHPSHPGQPGQPGHPSHPGQPGQPGHPSHPGQPGHPSHPDQPGHLCHPDQPGHLCHPDQPGHLSHPARPGQPDDPTTVVNYSLQKHSSSRTTSSTVNRTNTTNIIHPGGRPEDDDPYGPGYPRGPGSPHGPGGPHGPEGPYGPGGPHGPHGPGGPYGSIGPKGPGGPHGPHGPDSPKYPNKPESPGYGPDTTNGPTDPGQPGHPGSISITINKTTTRTTHTGYPGEPNGPHSPSDVPPVTSTPYPSRGRSVSPERPPITNAPHQVTYLSHVRSPNTDSLERVRRPRNDTLPFPDTSPIKGGGDGKIPRRVDDLMTSFSDSEDGPGNGPSNRGPRMDPADEEPLLPYNNQISVRAEADARAAADAHPQRELTKNKAGPPVYYPPGHELFHETMHTMTLKEGGRRGKAKWRMERSSGYKESSSSSETKGGMTMVPVCLPLCCGAACVVM